jgi:hypothetical protein
MKRKVRRKPTKSTRIREERRRVQTERGKGEQAALKTLNRTAPALLYVSLLFCRHMCFSTTSTLFLHPQQPTRSCPIAIASRCLPESRNSLLSRPKSQLTAAAPCTSLPVPPMSSFPRRIQDPCQPLLDEPVLSRHWLRRSRVKEDLVG